MLKVLERDYKQHVTDVCHEFPNCQFVMRVDALTDMSGYLLAISTSPDSADAFGEYLVENTDLEYLFVGGEYTSDFIGGLCYA